MCVLNNSANLNIFHFFQLENDPVSITLETAKETEEYMTPTTSNCKVAVYLTNEENGVQQVMRLTSAACIVWKKRTE